MAYSRIRFEIQNSATMTLVQFLLCSLFVSLPLTMLQSCWMLVASLLGNADENLDQKSTK